MAFGRIPSIKKGPIKIRDLSVQKKINRKSSDSLDPGESFNHRVKAARELYENTLSVVKKEGDLSKVVKEIQIARSLIEKAETLGGPVRLAEGEKDLITEATTLLLTASNGFKLEKDTIGELETAIQEIEKILSKT